MSNRSSQERDVRLYSMHPKGATTHKNSKVHYPSVLFLLSTKKKCFVDISQFLLLSWHMAERAFCFLKIVTMNQSGSGLRRQHIDFKMSSYQMKSSRSFAHVLRYNNSSYIDLHLNVINVISFSALFCLQSFWFRRWRLPP